MEYGLSLSKVVHLWTLCWFWSYFRFNQINVINRNKRSDTDKEKILQAVVENLEISIRETEKNTE